MPDATPPVFLVATLPEGPHAVLDGEEARHAVTVRRMRQGERLALCDGEGALAECVVESIRPGRAPSLELLVTRRRLEQPPALLVTVAQALIKGDRGELAVELATEAGADAVVPWRAARSIARWEEGARGAKALGRWRNAARVATKQARRGRVPTVSEPVDTDGLAELVSRAAGAVVLDAGAERTLAEVELPERGEFVLVVGPEGGVTEEEVDTLVAVGAIRARLGPTVLRASTAATVALGALGALTARWR
ncbi:16S rRNA (uracil1498-N3)-methyltransferase [Saccharomonospora amisosensis]|uniref:Ribosomal RNA small subunit methyltransferase E n=1 Tax=Saccharomonospora amisosensis TaxID=1128677 RepID=A0A7X5USL8_9PSEU|nr:16S rRNA (uracil(1498)-N(3))-methyltransferase [Saccharomonospora amisosensis]NIJ13117.1 16S rRNA (uracil1498-N3)-methyltransferase [Saccharomonospora amisosensis]